MRGLAAENDFIENVLNRSVNNEAIFRNTTMRFFDQSELHELRVNETNLPTSGRRLLS